MIWEEGALPLRGQWLLVLLLLRFGCETNRQQTVNAPPPCLA